ncbi:hypothetical protein GEMMAAP_04910 [Gemmatimonas phototrophica]|uniref:EBNA-1 nuclear protein n=1 Tax=Gemmatimonas phototrophica TaxID=1379270 RepID=A0A143BNG4_9BACT|nr:hypothetical protein GEMMAAP_04910 [Gemmatimonas phototrophica]
MILAEGHFGPQSSKTANACLRYIPNEVVAVLDSTQTGRTAQDILGLGGAIPVVGSFAEGMALAPTALLIGIAPAGGQFPEAWRAIVNQSLRAGLDVWSGLHTLLGDDAEFHALATKHGAVIRDLRRPPAMLDVGSGRVRELDATIVLTVGTDCNIGKMTTQLQVQQAVQARGPRVNFAATGQTGILVAGRGIAVDAVVADFIAGAAEALTMEAAHDAEIVLVEGQGSLLHPAYSGVTLGLMHGSLPHAMVLCAQPTRVSINRNAWVPIPPLTDVITLYERMMAPLRPSPVIAVALNTFDLDDEAAQQAIARAQEETGLPVTDPVRFDPSPIAEAIAAFHARRKLVVPS